MSKKFKLVYEQAGVVKGSYTGIPSKDDTNLIERSILEGSKEIKSQPEPKPQPEATAIEVTIEQVKDMFEALGLTPAEGEDEYYNFEYNQEYVCHCSGAEVVDMWNSLDTELLQRIFEDVGERNSWFSFDGFPIYRMSENCIASETEMLSNRWYGNYDSYTNFSLYQVSVETDAETGDSWSVCAGWPAGQVELRLNRHK